MVYFVPGWGRKMYCVEWRGCGSSDIRIDIRNGDSIRGSARQASHARLGVTSFDVGFISEQDRRVSI
jgi:hypothetical protein